MAQYRKSPRAPFIDYDEGAYFITICTKNSRYYFGDINDGIMYLSKIGSFVSEQLRRASEINPSVRVDTYVVMPNHIHAIIFLSKNPEPNSSAQRPPNPSLRANAELPRYVPALSRYVNSFKGAVTKYAKSIGCEFGWHSRYHDHLIRGHKEELHIAQYIIDNVKKWEEDCFYPDK